MAELRTHARLLMLLVVLVLPGDALAQTRGRVVETGVTAPEVLSFGQAVNVSGRVTGDVQVAGASAVISGEVGGDVVALFGDIDLAPGATIAGDVICIGGRVAGVESAKIGGEVLAPATLSGGLGMPDPGSAVRQRPFSLVASALKLSLLFAWLVVGVVFALASGKEVRAASTELRSSTWHTLILGAVAFTSYILTALVFSYLISFMVGIPLLVLLGAFALLTKIFGMVAVFHAVGALVTRPKDRGELERRKWLRGDLAMIIIGLVILGAIRMIPYVGNVVWAVASLSGIGVSLATKFGRREPWFLAWQTVTQRVR